MVLQRVEESLDLMITLKDSLLHYRSFLQERIEKCNEATGKIPGFISQIEKLVKQGAEAIRELTTLRGELSGVKERYQSLQSDLYIVNELDGLEAKIRDREEAKKNLLGRLNISECSEGEKLLDLDIQALAEYRQHQLRSLKERDINRDKVRPLLEALEARIIELTKECNQKEQELRRIGETRQQLTSQFSEFKILDSERHRHEVSFANLERIIELVEGVSFSTESPPVEARAQMEGVQC
jgi:chromosome segregation ATPase